jgi:hypothetical protein
MSHIGTILSPRGKTSTDSLHEARWPQKWNGTNENCVGAPPTCPGALKRCDLEPDMLADMVSVK